MRRKTINKRNVLTRKNTTPNNRDENGRWLKGAVSPNPNGRPALSAELPLIEGIKAAVSAEQVAQALEKLFAMGMKGNVKALTAWLAYAVGKPVEHIDMTSDGNELRGLTADHFHTLDALARQQISVWEAERHANQN